MDWLSVVEGGCWGGFGVVPSVDDRGGWVGVADCEFGVVDSPEEACVVGPHGVDCVLELLSGEGLGGVYGGVVERFVFHGFHFHLLVHFGWNGRWIVTVHGYG